MIVTSALHRKTDHTASPHTEGISPSPNLLGGMGDGKQSPVLCDYLLLFGSKSLKNITSQA